MLKSNDVENFIDELYKLRQEGINTGGESDLRNLVFKEFRALGYLDNLKTLKLQLKSKELSLEHLEEQFKQTALNVFKSFRHSLLYNPTISLKEAQSLLFSYNKHLLLELCNLAKSENKELKNILKSEELSLESLQESHDIPTDEDIRFLRDWLNLGKDSYLKGFDPENQTAFIVFPKGVKLDMFDNEDETNIANALKSRGFKVDISKGDYTYKTVGSFNSREMKTKGKGYDRTLKDRVRMDVSWAPYPLDEELNTNKYNTREKLAQLRKEYPEDGTYSVDKKGNITREELSDGFMVSFFKPEIEDKDISFVLKTIGTKLGTPYLGIFEDAPEISYKFDSEDRALEFAKLFNQKAIWDNENQIIISNPSHKNNKKVNYSNILDALRAFINHED